MASDKTDYEERDVWPEGPEATLLFQTVAHLHRQNIKRMLDVFPYDEFDIKPSPALEESIARALNKARRKATWDRRKNTIRKAAAVAALVIVCLLATPTVLFAVSSDFRETVYNFIVDWRQGHVDVNIEAGLPAEQTFPKYYMPSLIPDGFVLKDYIDDKTIFELYYSNDEQYFYFTTRKIVVGSTVDTESAELDFNYRVNGLPAITSENRGIITIMWHDDETAFTFETNLSLETALEIAASYNLQENFL